MKLYFKFLICTIGLLVSISCNNDDSSASDTMPLISTAVNVVNAFPNLSFDRPVDFQSPNDNTDRIFIAEQKGVIRVFQNNMGTEQATTFLDIQDRINFSSNEMGLLGMAFHPDYQNNGFFYVCYTTFNSSVISRFQVSSISQNIADSASETILLTVGQPFANHNGGQLAFGSDGYLYIAMGDGGSAGDPQGNAQNLNNLLGAILRINVDQSDNGLNYAIPSDNPFIDTNFRREIYAYGLRNPWRMSFDPQTGLLWAGDVGQGEIEEIDIIENGNNYGWNTMEGTRCFESLTCNQTDLTTPIFEYSHNNGDLSITGGYVYRGIAIPEMQGFYIYGDFVSGRIWGLDATNSNTSENQLIEDTNLNISSFGTDMNNELYFCSFDGQIYTFKLTE
ncbi:PQQ-dependent sugar dehydrogenase [Leptobacterium sp. I13]|uniref:PQQ-dependent sugar dehydrogenase n=1 Tax=Leptobacterium meishanense TaxID=3128904 RepID=UPI0030ED852D